jgi:hypothetical protein
MNINAVESALLVAVGYDETSEVLQLEFRSHAVYRYFGVPGSVYAALVAAPSKGGYFNGAIRGHFPYSLISKSGAGRRGEF